MTRTHTWEISDEFWALVEPLLPETRRGAERIYKRKPGGGRKAKHSDRLYFAGIVYVLRTGIIWNAFPREKFEGLGSSVLHSRFRQWAKAGLFEAIWKKGLAEYDEMEGIAWEWQSGDGTNVEAPLARESVGPNPTDRGKNGSKRHALVDGHGVPLSLVVSGANTHDSKRIGALLDARMARPADEMSIENLCLDAGYVGKAGEVAAREYVPHIRPRGEEISESKRDLNLIPRRWVVECFHSWMNRFRKLIPRYEKTDLSYCALLHLAAAMITLNKIMTIYG